MSLSVRPFSPDQTAAWNTHNESALNGHFLFDRGFMEYHADRFRDASVMVFREDTLIATMPANVVGDTVYSHQGLTFGGLLVGRTPTDVVVSIFEACLGFYADLGAKELVYKPSPPIYHRGLAQADLYGLFRTGARLTRRDVTTTIDYHNPGSLSSRRRRGVSKAQKLGLTAQQSDRWPEFWRILEQTLQERHGVAPVHALSEIEMLAARFPNNIKLFTAQQDADVVAGVVVFETPTVAHAQYIAASRSGRDVGALDLLFNWLIQTYQPSKGYFDFGISTEEGGRVLNQGLLTQKEEFGGSAVMHDTYTVALQG
ncbi:GNAT family N-acetyltransferase [Methylobacterium sp. E-046]|uniref:GNAT family N-acetyltransferase n=1 Tax=Methylobacterium sp. E-046 TaxID=2836576 RepID=UPI001FBAE8A8|nr:GNAT family N-acetyltransferase [Methylobacterium sp. E-046]MCJ2099397.1 GNAT family N-acetyltransferase [Methylobacterium sp. E-046]